MDHKWMKRSKRIVYIVLFSLSTILLCYNLLSGFFYVNKWQAADGHGVHNKNRRPAMESANPMSNSARVISVASSRGPRYDDTLLTNQSWANDVVAKALNVVMTTHTRDQDSRRSNEEIHVAFVAKYAYKKMKVVRNILRCFVSILQLTSSPLHLHVLLDHSSHTRVTRTLTKVAMETRKSFKVSFHDIDVIIEKFQQVIKVMRKHFFTKDVGRYNDDIFFITEIMHWALPISLKRLIVIDLDLKFKTDIFELYRHFNYFAPSNVIGMAFDLQPHYRADFAKYRSLNPNTTVGSPRPGHQGFNTGVMLLDLQRMRHSNLYNSLIDEKALTRLCDKYFFEGYLAHQDFFTLTGMEYPELYYVLDCTWNRQLDTGYLPAVGKEVFEQYHKCDGDVKVYHGNGDSVIPDS